MHISMHTVLYYTVKVSREKEMLKRNGFPKAYKYSFFILIDFVNGDFLKIY